MARPREFDEHQVVQQAMGLFWEKGFRQTTPRDLLAVTGLSKSSLYATFGSKRGLFLRALASYTDEQADYMRAMLASGTLREALTRMYDQVLAVVTRTEGPDACLVCVTALEVDDDAEVTEELGHARLRIEAVLRERIARAREEGQVATERDPAALARFVFSNNMGLVVLARAGAEEAELRQVVDEVLSAVCD